MKKYTAAGRGRFFRAALLVLFIFVFALFPFLGKTEKGGDRGVVSASAANWRGDVISIDKYYVYMGIREDRTVHVSETITVTFWDSDLSMFYRSLPLEGGRYYDIEASCSGNGDFSYYVDENPDLDGFLDINCVGGVSYGQTWTYTISYIMESGLDTEEVIIDVIPFGFTVPLHNVSAQIQLPTEIDANDYALYVGFGSQAAGNVDHKLMGDTISLSTDVLNLRYNDTYGETVADGITLKATLPEGTFKSYASTRMFTEEIVYILIAGVVCVGGVIVLSVVMKKKREIVTVVNLKAPDDMDPMQMGKLLDGVVDNEDVTSMIYYFAHKGYLDINFENEDDPVFIRKTERLPSSESAHAATLFDGLFRGKNTARVSDLQEKFYTSVEKARMQVPLQNMYDGKSMLWFFLGGAIGILFAFLVFFLMGLSKIGGDYTYVLGIVLALPTAAIWLVAWIRENYRYKWKPAYHTLAVVAEFAIAVIGTLIFVFCFANHVTTEYEKLLTCIVTFACTFLTLGMLTRTEKHLKKLGHILGFKDFIVVAEKERLEAMLEEDPQLYYKILPYAQVLGVTDIWENKFEDILIEPPAWCTGWHTTAFDYMIMHRCMTRAMVTAMMQPQNTGGGSSMGRTGSFGGFGGFGGGGFGGGGGGAR